jgi:hypothetical protein
MTVEPHVVHRLTITPKGFGPWSRDLELGLDESRVFMLSPVHARAKQANPQAVIVEAPQAEAPAEARSADR